MHHQANGPIIRSLRGAAATLSKHRTRIAVGAALILFIWALVWLAPLILALALVERRRRRRRFSLLATLALIGAVAWLWRELTRNPHEPHGAWHPCRQCGYPIPNTSRAHYCSPGCRRIARLTARVAVGDERAAWRLARLTRKDDVNPAWGEVPF